MDYNLKECYVLAELVEKKLIEVRDLNDKILINKYEELLLQVFDFIGKIIDIELKK